jgi:hypothetical protein
MVLVDEEEDDGDAHWDSRQHGDGGDDDDDDDGSGSDEGDTTETHNHNQNQNQNQNDHQEQQEQQPQDGGQEQGEEVDLLREAAPLYQLPALVEHRAAMKKERKGLKELEKKRKELLGGSGGGDGSSMDFGPDGEFFPLKGQCFKLNHHAYTYEMCPFQVTTTFLLFFKMGNGGMIFFFVCMKVS